MDPGGGTLFINLDHPSFKKWFENDLCGVTCPGWRPRGGIGAERERGRAQEGSQERQQPALPPEGSAALVAQRQRAQYLDRRPRCSFNGLSLPNKKIQKQLVCRRMIFPFRDMCTGSCSVYIRSGCRALQHMLSGNDSCVHCNSWLHLVWSPCEQIHSLGVGQPPRSMQDPGSQYGCGRHRHLHSIHYQHRPLVGILEFGVCAWGEAKHMRQWGVEHMRR